MKHKEIVFTDEQKALTFDQQIFIGFFKLGEIEKADEFANDVGMTLDDRKQAVETMKWGELK